MLVTSLSRIRIKRSDVRWVAVMVQAALTHTVLAQRSLVSRLYATPNLLSINNPCRLHSCRHPYASLISVRCRFASARPRWFILFHHSSAISGLPEGETGESGCYGVRKWSARHSFHMYVVDVDAQKLQIQRRKQPVSTV